MTECICLAISDETTSIVAGVDKIKFRMPYAFTVSKVKASLTVAAITGGNAGTVFDINESGVSILSTKLSIDQNELSTSTAAVAAVISDTVLADDAEITIDIDLVSGTAAKGAKVYIIGFKTAEPV